MLQAELLWRLLDIVLQGNDIPAQSIRQADVALSMSLSIKQLCVTRSKSCATSGWLWLFPSASAHAVRPEHSCYGLTSLYWRSLAY